MFEITIGFAAPLLATVGLPWWRTPEFFVVWTVVIGIACLLCDWHLWQTDRQRNLFSVPDWKQVRQLRFTLSDLLEAICLLSAAFLLARTYLGTAIPGKNRSVVRLDPNAFLASGLIVVAMLAWRFRPQPMEKWRMILLGVIVGLLMIGRLTHPAGALFVPALVGVAIVAAERANTLTFVVIWSYACGVVAIWQFGDRPRYQDSPFLYDLVGLLTVTSSALLIASLALLPISAATMRRAGLYVVIVAVLSQQTIMFSRDIFHSLQWSPDTNTVLEYRLGIRAIRRPARDTPAGMAR